jgi:hypothetical protein
MAFNVRDEYELAKQLGMTPEKLAERMGRPLEGKPPGPAAPHPTPRPRVSLDMSYEVHPGGGYTIWVHKDGLVSICGWVATEEEAQQICTVTPLPPAKRTRKFRPLRFALAMTVLSWVMDVLLRCVRAFVKRNHKSSIA